MRIDLNPINRIQYWNEKVFSNTLVYSENHPDRKTAEERETQLRNGHTQEKALIEGNIELLKQQQILRLSNVIAGCNGEPVEPSRRSPKHVNGIMR